MNQKAIKGAGVGLRIPHIQHVLKNKPRVPWFEVHICNFLSAPLNRQLLLEISKDYPISFHGVSLNLGGTAPLNPVYLSSLKQAVDEFQPALVSEHACFTSLNEQYFHDLLPIPYTSQAVGHFADRIDQVQDTLGRPILIENISKYFEYAESTLTEAEFLAALCSRTGCKLVLDINNIYVNQFNFPENKDLLLEHYLQSIPYQHIGEIHLAGHSQCEGQLIDTHSCPVSDDVWNLFTSFIHQWEIKAKDKTPPPCLIEWDSQLPEFSVLEQEQTKAESLMRTYRASSRKSFEATM